MAKGWVDNIYNDGGETKWEIMSSDDRHNGKISGVNLDGGDWGKIPSRHSRCDWFGIPWFYKGKHFKALWNNSTGAGIKFYHQSENGGKNWIYFENRKTGKTVARQQFPNDDYHAKMIFDGDTFDIEIINVQYSTDDFVKEGLLDGAKWAAETFGTAIIEALA